MYACVYFLVRISILHNVFFSVPLSAIMKLRTIWGKVYRLLLAMSLFSCKESKEDLSTHMIKNTPSVYLNHSDSAKYVGKQTCMLCHQTIYNSFIHTGMGRSWRWATKTNSAAHFLKSHVYDSLSDFHYSALLKNDSIYIKEYRLDKQDTVFMMLKKIDFIVGSGHHTNSHLYWVNGYLYQAPMTFYTQKGIWDLPPGFENGHNTRFFRKIGIECITCHNAYPEFVKGSENKYTYIPTGIDCERCHGPGSIHVNKIRRGDITDTSKDIDYSIVNPAKLPIDRQFDICMRCHLQGNAVLVDQASFFDFKPGMRLNNFIQVFLPRYSDSKDNFIMASHADRLKQSPCFIQSLKKNKTVNTLKPYKQVLTCVTCHNPHISVKETENEKFDAACISCHHPGGMSEKICSSTEFQQAQKKGLKNKSCVSCHMPVSGSKDIPHVTIHDHFIRIPEKISSTKTKNKKTRLFLGLVCINDSNPTAETRAKAYLYQYEKFDPFSYYLDSAENILKIKSKGNILPYIHTYIHLLFLQQKMHQIDRLIQQKDIQQYIQDIHSDDLLNTRAWTLYRIGEAEYQLRKYKEAEQFFERAVTLAPYILEFRNKLAVTQMQTHQSLKAYQNWLYILQENPMFIPAYSNLGLLKLQQNQLDSAYYYLKKGQSIDPDNDKLLTNMIAYYIRIKAFDSARKITDHLLKKYPSHPQAKHILQYLNHP